MVVYDKFVESDKRDDVFFSNIAKNYTKIINNNNNNNNNINNINNNNNNNNNNNK